MTCDDDTRATLDGAPVELEEARTYRLMAPQGASACWDARALERGEDGTFVIEVGHWVSSAPLELRVSEPGVADAVWSVVVRPRRAKADGLTWAVLLEELDAWLPGATLGWEAGKHGNVGHMGAAAPHLAEALWPLVGEVLRALSAVLDAPRTRNVAAARESALRKVRRPDASVVRQVLRCTQESVALGDARVIEAVVEDRLDHPVNRYVAWLLAKAESALRLTSVALAEYAARAQHPDPAWCASRAARLDDAAGRIGHRRRRSFLAAISPAPPSEAALLVVADDPAYARLHRLLRHFVSPRFQLDTGPLAAATRPSFTLYELWCFLALRRALAQRLEQESLAWSTVDHALSRILTAASGEGASTTFSHPDRGELRLEFNPTFVSWFARRPGAARYSISAERRPDLILTWLPVAPAELPAWIAFDAKWRAGRSNLGEGFESVHIYRDSLRDDARGGHCRAAFLLAPASTDDVAGWFEPSFRERWRCGIFELRPGMPGAESAVTWSLEALGLALMPASAVDAAAAGEPR